MKKLLLAFMVMMMCINSAAARYWHGGRHHRPYRYWNGGVTYRPYYPYHHTYVRPYEPLASVLPGMVGAAVGSYFISSLYRPVHNSNTYCFMLTSDNHKKSVERCVSLEEGWSRGDIERAIYID